MRKRLVLAVLAASLACGVAHASMYQVMYSFGDSLSDVGNVYTSSGRVLPISPYFEGRFSNNYNWVDDLTAKLGLGTHATPSALGGNDFAWGGAQTGTTIVSGMGVPVPSLGGQVGLFDVADPHPNPDALYTLDIGANDILNAVTALKDGSITYEQMTTKFLNTAVMNTVDAVTGLYDDGMRSLLYYQVPDLSVVPDYEALGAPYAADAGMLAMDFNTDVVKYIKASADLSGLTVFDVPIFADLDKIVADPPKFGFTNATTPCFSGSFDSPGTECADPNDYVFWDGEHPTAAAHALTADVAYAVLNGAPDPIAAPEPSTCAMMLIGFAGLGFVGWRAQRSRAAIA